MFYRRVFVSRRTLPISQRKDAEVIEITPTAKLCLHNGQRNYQNGQFMVVVSNSNGQNKGMNLEYPQHPQVMYPSNDGQPLTTGPKFQLIVTFAHLGADLYYLWC